MAPTTTAVLTLLISQGRHGLTAMDAMRAIGVSGASLTKRISELRLTHHISVNHSQAKDPITKRVFGRYTLKAYETMPKAA